MPPQLAAFVFAGVILGLFWLDRDERDRSSPFLWVAVLWIALACSRSASQWLNLGVPMDVSDALLEGDPTNRLTYSVLLLLGLAVLAARSRRVYRVLSSQKLVIAFFGYCLLSLLWSEFPSVGFKRWTKAVGDLVMVLIVLTDRNPAGALKRLLSRITFLLIPLSVLFIKYYPDFGRSYGRWEGEVHYTGVTTNKNSLGSLCLLFGLASLWRLLGSNTCGEGPGRRRRQIAHAIILAIVVWLFWMVNSMTSLSCFLLVGTVLFAVKFWHAARRPAVMHRLIAGAVVVALFALFVAPELLVYIGRSATLTDRTGIWGLAVGLTPSSVVGAGYESFWLGPRLAKIWSVYVWGPLEAHNGYLEIFLNLGMVGCALLGAVLVAGYRSVMAGFCGGGVSGSLMLAFFVSGVIYNFTEAAYFRMMTPSWIFLLLALMGASLAPWRVRADSRLGGTVPQNVVNVATEQRGRTVLEGNAN